MPSFNGILETFAASLALGIFKSIMAAREYFKTGLNYVLRGRKQWFNIGKCYPQQSGWASWSRRVFSGCSGACMLLSEGAAFKNSQGWRQHERLRSELRPPHPTEQTASRRKSLRPKCEKRESLFTWSGGVEGSSTSWFFIFYSLFFFQQMKD